MRNLRLASKLLIAQLVILGVGALTLSVTAIAALGSPVNRSMKDLLKTLSFKTVTPQEISAHLLQDVDTKEDMKRVSDLYKLMSK